MNKTELIRKMSKKSGFTIKDTETLLNSFLEVAYETFSKGESIRLVGFGTFEVKERKAREGRNPRNPKEKIHIPARKAVAFKEGKQLKERVNNLIK